LHWGRANSALFAVGRPLVRPLARVYNSTQWVKEEEPPFLFPESKTPFRSNNRAFDQQGKNNTTLLCVRGEDAKLDSIEHSIVISDTVISVPKPEKHPRIASCGLEPGLHTVSPWLSEGHDLI
jgi:hypothetical protein